MALFILVVVFYIGGLVVFRLRLRGKRNIQSGLPSEGRKWGRWSGIVEYGRIFGWCILFSGCSLVFSRVLFNEEDTWSDNTYVYCCKGYTLFALLAGAAGIISALGAIVVLCLAVAEFIRGRRQQTAVMPDIRND